MCVCVCVYVMVCALQYELLSVLFEGQLAVEHINSLSQTASDKSGVSHQTEERNEGMLLQFHTDLYQWAMILYI